jgi:hypothetical protein
MKKYDVVYAQRYQAGGEEKTKWLNCGSVIQTAKGFRLKLDSVPLGCDGWFALFEPKEADAPQKPQAAPAVHEDFQDSQIPF